MRDPQAEKIIWLSHTPFADFSLDDTIHGRPVELFRLLNAFLMLYRLRGEYKHIPEHSLLFYLGGLMIFVGTWTL